MTKSQIIRFLESKNDKLLLEKSDKTRRLYCQDDVYIRGLVEFSNYCLRDCLYCGLRRSNKKIKRYRMPSKDIIETARVIIGKGIKTIVLQSGDDFFYNRKKIVKMINSIKKINKDVAVTLSVGERPLDEYKAFFDAGASRYLLKHETANASLYKKLHPGQSLQKRKAILYNLRKIGYQIGCGSIVGLPQQSLKDLAEDVLFIEDMQPDMVGLGPFISQSDTPLSTTKSPQERLVIKMLALCRIVTKNAHIPATTALATLDRKKGYVNGLKAGCNVIMVNFTPKAYSNKYRIYNDKLSTNLKIAKEAIEKAKRRMSFEKGDSLKV
jgi:biotin synthase